MTTISLGAFNLQLLSENENLVKLSNATDISPSEISTARCNFIIFSCVVIPLGFVMAYVFLHLYFKFDKGFFTVAQLQFEYCQQTSVGQNQVTGSWIDLSGQDNDPNLHTNESINDDTNEADFIRCLKLNEVEQEDDFIRRLKLNEEEKILFDEIKNSFPYYKRKNTQQMEEDQNSTL